MTRRLGALCAGCLLGIVAALPGFASDARDAALQSRGWMTADDASIWRFPTDLQDYPNQVYGELVSEIAGHDHAGGHLRTNGTTWRVFVGDFPRGAAGTSLLQGTRRGTLSTGNVLPQDVENAFLVRGDVPDGRAHLLIARPVGEKGRAAIGFDYSASTWSDALSPGPSEGTPGAGSSRLDRASLFNGHAGLSLPVAPFEQLAIGFHFGRPSFEGSREQATLGAAPYIQKSSYEDDGGRFFGLNVRGTRRDLLGPNTEAILYASFESGALDGTSRKNTATDGSPRVDSRKELRTTSFAVGWANNHHLSARLLAIWGTELDWTGDEINVDDEAFSGSDTATRTESTVTAISWPATLAVEGWLRSWWAARVSASSSLWSRTKTSARYEDRRTPQRSIPENRSISAGSHQEVGIGTTLRFAGLSVDGVVNRSLLYDGPYFLGGSSTGIWTQLSLRYEF